MNPSKDTSLAGLAWPSEETTRCPFPAYERLRHEAPVYKVPDRDEFLITRWDDIVYVAKRPELFSNSAWSVDATLRRVDAARQSVSAGGPPRRYSTASMASSDPPEHKAKRALGLKLVARERLHEYESRIQELVDELIDDWIDRGECDFRAEFSDLLPIRLIVDLLGLPREDVPRFKVWGETEAGAVRYLPEDRVEVEMRWAMEAMAYMRDAVLDRFERPRDDYLTEMITQQIAQDGEFDPDYMASEANVMLLAGNVTTAHALANSLVILCQNPDAMERVRDDRTLLRNLVEEVLRLESPVQWLQRVAVEDTEINGMPIPAGSLLILFWASGNRDDSRFPEPDAFELDRPNGAKHQLAFGHGIHLCLGAALARLELRIALEILLNRLTNIRIIEGESDLENIDSLRFRAPKVLRIAFDPAPAI